MGFWVLIGGKWQGPRGYDELRAELQSGSLTAETLVSINQDGKDPRKLGQVVGFTESLISGETVPSPKNASPETSIAKLERHVFHIDGTWVAVDGTGTIDVPYVVMGVEVTPDLSQKAASQLLRKNFGIDSKTSDAKAITLPSGRRGGYAKITRADLSSIDVYFDVGEAWGDGPSSQPKPSSRSISELMPEVRQALIPAIQNAYPNKEMSASVAELLLMEMISDPKNGITEGGGVLGNVFSEGFTLRSEPPVDSGLQENVLPGVGPEQTENPSLPNGGEKLDLIALEKWPSMPSPWSSDSPGETWVWGDFFLILQSNPKLVAALMAEMQGRSPPPQTLSYPYALTVFYRRDRNPHGPSSRPVATMTLEKADLSALGGPKVGPIMVGLFLPGQRLNFGEYSGTQSMDAVRLHFFELLKNQIPVTGQPRRIGTMADAYGHPDTGLPARKEKSGCLGALLIVGGALAAGSVLPSLLGHIGI